MPVKYLHITYVNAPSVRTGAQDLPTVIPVFTDTAQMVDRRSSIVVQAASKLPGAVDFNTTELVTVPAWPILTMQLLDTP